MGHFARRVLALAMLLTIAAVTLAATEPPFAQWRAGAAELTAIDVAFTQEKFLPIIDKPLVSTGRFAFVAPRSVRWEYEAPVRLVILARGDTIERFTFRDGAFQRDEAGLEALQIVIQNVNDWLRGDFATNPLFAMEAAPASREVILTPTDKAIGEFLTEIRLELSDTPGVIKSLTLRERGDIRTRLTFTDVKLNQPPPGERFTKP